MAWVYLIVAGLLEVVWAFAMKQSEGFTRLPYAAISLGAMVASVLLLSISMRVLPLGTAYMAWTGIGAVGAFIAGVMLLGESMSMMRLTAAVLIVGGLVIMKLSGD